MHIGNVGLGLRWPGRWRRQSDIAIAEVSLTAVSFAVRHFFLTIASQRERLCAFSIDNRQEATGPLPAARARKRRSCACESKTPPSLSHSQRKRKRPLILRFRCKSFARNTRVPGSPESLYLPRGGSRVMAFYFGCLREEHDR